MTTIENATAQSLGEITVRVPRWLARNEGYKSCELHGDVLAVSAKAVQVRAHALVRPSDNCLRCGKEITNPVSRLVGYGPWCSDELGIPRNPDPADVERIAAEVAAQVVTVWLPISRIEILDGEIPTPAPRAATSTPSGVPGADGTPPLAPPSPDVTIVVDGDRIVVRSPITFKDALKSIPGRLWAPKDKQPPRGAWTFPASPHAAQAIADVFRGSDLTIEADEATKALRKMADTHVEAAAHKTAAELPAVPCSATDAWLHQRQAYWFVEPLPAAMLAMDMGTGKSKVVVDLVCGDPDTKRVLIMCPKSVVGVWPREFRTHGGRDVTVVAPRKGPRGGPLSVAKRVAEIRDALDRAGDRTVVVVVNYESAWRDEMSKTLLGVEWDVVVLDESHRIKKPGGKASMFASKLRPHARRRLALTGTPMPHSPLDVYAQFRFLDPGIFGTSFVNFRSHYAVMGGYGGHEILRYQRQDELAERMYRIAFRVMADDVLDLPPSTHVDRTCVMSPAARKTYTELVDKMVAEVEGGVVSAANVLVKLLRAQQITSGWLPLDDDGGDGERQWVQVDTAKRDLLADVLDELPVDEPVCVACKFTGDLDNVRMVAESQGRRYAELSGRDHSGLTDDALMRDDIDVLGVQIQAGGVGVDLTRAHYAVNYSVGYSLGDWEQWLRREDRPGQLHPVTFVNLACEDTIDEKVYAALRARKDLVEFVLSLTDKPSQAQVRDDEYQSNMDRSHAADYDDHGQD